MKASQKFRDLISTTTAVSRFQSAAVVNITRSKNCNIKTQAEDAYVDLLLINLTLQEDSSIAKTEVDRNSGVCR